MDVWKLQKDTETWEYVQTHTTYGSDSDGSWGQANTVVEDYGGINRTTQNQHYTSWGKADQVLDAAGRIFSTSYDLDGQVLGVSKTEGSTTIPVVTYTYGSTPPGAGQVDVTYGQPLSVTDNLSGVSQSFTYAVSGGGLGQPSSVTESGGGNPSYTTSYTYTTSGERQTATYSTPNGTTRWGYYDYVALGNITSPVRPFETLAKLDANGNRTGEKFHYAYGTCTRNGIEIKDAEGIGMRQVFIHLQNFFVGDHEVPHLDFQWLLDIGKHETLDRIIIEALRSFKGCE